MINYIKVADSSDVKGKMGYAVTVEDERIVLFRFNETVYAFKDKCPHQGAPMSDGFAKNGYAVCMYHGWQFKLKDGSFINNTTLKLKQYPVKEENGDILIKID